MALLDSLMLHDWRKVQTFRRKRSFSSSQSTFLSQRPWLFLSILVSSLNLLFAERKTRLLQKAFVWVFRSFLKWFWGPFCYGSKPHFRHRPVFSINSIVFYQAVFLINYLGFLIKNTAKFRNLKKIINSIFKVKKNK